MTELYGVYRGVVVTNADPENRLRVRATVPSVTGASVTDWCWPCVTPGPHVMAPKPGAGVWVMYENGSVDYPIWLGVFEEQIALQPPKPHPHSHAHITVAVGAATSTALDQPT